MTRRSRSAALAALLFPASAGLAQPGFIALGVSAGDISANGNAAAGQVYDALQQRHVVYTWTRGVGAFRTGATIASGVVRASADAAALAFDAYNLENYGGFGTDRHIAHRWTQATGSVNLGIQTNGSVCDYISTAADISGDGRYVVGSGWTGAGAPNCSAYRAWIYDAQTAAFTQLPTSLVHHPVIPGLTSAARTTVAVSVSGDGTVVCGYDENYNTAWTGMVRRAVVWTSNAGAWTQTTLDPEGGTAVTVNTTGNVVVGRFSVPTMQSTFGTSVCTPIEWSRQGGIWVPQNLGGDDTMLAQWVSADGNTIVGPGGAGTAWIWRPTISGGVPTDLESYLASVGGNWPDMHIGELLGSSPLHGLSDDGNAMIVSWLDARNTCLTTGTSSIIYLNGAACEPPRIDFNPVSQTQAVGEPLPPYGIILNVFVSGTWPLNYQWQKETSPGVWENLVHDPCPTNYSPENFDRIGTDTRQLRLGSLSGTWAGNYRCVVSNPECGSVISAVAVVGPPQTCYPNCDSSTTAPILNISDFTCFLNRFAAGDPWGNCDGSTTPPVLNITDFTCFLNAFAAGCP
jgi:hypothetical protein